MDAPIANIGSIALRMALGYAVFGCIWILGSDRLVAALVSDPATLTLVQSWKGLLFVLLSAALIFTLGAFFMRALAFSEFRYRSLFSDSPEALVIYDLDTLRIKDTNQAMADLLGYDLDELRQCRLPDFMPPHTADFLQHSLPRLRDKSLSVSTVQLRHKSGRLIDISSKGQTFAIGKEQYRYVVVMDITAKVRAETELLRTVEDLTIANERLHQLGHALSHDLQEPLRQVAGFVQLLERRYAHTLDAEASEFIGYAVEGVERLKSLLAAVEDFARQEPHQPQMVAARAVLDTVLDDLDRAITSCHAHITVGPLPLVHADPRRLAVVLHTLLDNAIKFRRLDTHCDIVVSAAADLGGWIFRIQDNGIGIDPEFHQSIFSLFRRLHSRDRIPGNGTGLALAKKMVESWGGRIWVEPAPPHGSVFAFSVPSGPDSAPAH